ncbi:MAG TPA: Uma2 family endonuclease [Aeromicrobium sp.]|nr:Uma2 family endonuclease [Aeromicrobium sp.]
MATRTGLSIEEFLAGDWPADTQLVDGEVIMNDPTFRHQKISGRIHYALETWVRQGENRGEAGWGCNWTLAPGQVFKPDVWWTAEDAKPGINAVRSDSPPTLAVEVRSPGTWHLDRGRKRDVYEQAGVAELWLVDTPERAVLMFRRSTPDAVGFDVTAEIGPGDTLTTPLLEGFSQAIDDLFAD